MNQIPQNAVTIAPTMGHIELQQVRFWQLKKWDSVSSLTKNEKSSSRSTKNLSRPTRIPRMASFKQMDSSSIQIMVV